MTVVVDGVGGRRGGAMFGDAKPRTSTRAMGSCSW